MAWEDQFEVVTPGTPTDMAAPAASMTPKWEDQFDTITPGTPMPARDQTQNLDQPAQKLDPKSALNTYNMLKQGARYIDPETNAERIKDGFSPEHAQDPANPWKFDQYAPAHEAKPAVGMLENAQAGYQATVMGMIQRGKLPDLYTDPNASNWVERGVSALANILPSLPVMIPAGIVGAPAGAAAGGAVAGPAGALFGGLFSGGFSAGAADTALRESIMLAYKSGEIHTKEEWWGQIKTAILHTGESGLTMGGAMVAGGGASRLVGAVVGPTIGTTMSAGTALAIQKTADLAGQVAAFPTIPAALEGRMPDAQEFADAAVILGALAGGHKALSVVRERSMNVYAKTGKTPAEQVADAQADPSIKEEMIRAKNAEVTGTYSGVPIKLDRLIASAMRDWQIPVAPTVKDLIKNLKREVPTDRQGTLFSDAERMDALVTKAEGGIETVITNGKASTRMTEPTQLTDAERIELDTLRTKVAAGFHETEISRESSLQKVYDDVRQQMVDAGRGADEAAAIASLQRARYDMIAREVGRDPWDAWSTPEDWKAMRIRGEGEAGTGETAPAPKPLSPDAAPEWTEVKRKSTIPGINPPKTYERQDEVGTRTMTKREIGVQSDKSIGQFDATDQEGSKIIIRVERNHLTGKTMLSLGMGVKIDITSLLAEGVTLPEAIQRTFSTKDIPTKYVKPKAAEADKAAPMRGLDDPEIASMVKGMANEAGWLQVGGKLDIARLVEEHGPDILDANGRPTKLGVVAFTEWIPKEEWWRTRPDKTMNEDKYIAAIDKALRGEKLNKAEQRAIDDLIRIANERAQVIEDIGPENFADAVVATKDMDAGPTIENIVDTTLIVRAMEINMEKANRADELSNGDDAVFMKEIRRIIDEHEAEGKQGGTADAGRQDVADNAPDRRKTQPHKKPVNEMTTEELRTALLRHELTGIPNKRAYDDSVKLPRQASVDVDSLKWVNDNMGHEAGNELLKAAAAALTKHSKNAYHISGDEFFVQGHTDAELHAALNAAQKTMADIEIIHVAPDGTRTRVTGGFSYGTAKTIEEADQLLGKNKASREQSGHRAPRGDVPPGATRTTTEGRKVDIQSTQAAKEKPVSEMTVDELRQALTDKEAEKQAAQAPDTRLFQKVNQTETPEFKAWFGDSKVVDDNGKPLVVYHGTAADFTEFSHAAAYTGEGASQSGSGFYFTTERESSSNYASMKGVDTGVVYPVYLSIKKPVFIDFRDGEVFGTEHIFTRNEVKKILMSVENIKDPDGPLSNFDDITFNGFNKVLNEAIDAYAGSSNFAALRNDFFTNNADWLKSLNKVLGYDGAYSILDDGTKHYVAWFPEQIKSAIGNKGTFDPNNPNILFQKVQPLWYSELGRKIDDAKMDQAPAKGWKDYIRGLTQKGVKPDEVKWSGIEDWLNAQEGKVSKQQVAEFLKEGGVKVEEVVAGDESTIKFGDFQLPGGNNYKELLLTLPETKNRLSEEDAARLKYLEHRHTSGAFDTLRGKPQYMELVELRAKERATTFKSGHFEEPNILAHVRFNERTDADGKKVLFVEEIQSDWAQKGKKEGFAERVDKWPVEFNNGDVVYYKTEAEARRVAAERNGTVTSVQNIAGVPSAPFVGKTDAWVALSMKRMIRYAAENGFDKVAWTNGEQQISRYTGSLRQSVDSIEWTKTDNGVQIKGYKNKNKVVDTVEKEDVLSDSIGKAMAERIHNDPNQSGTIEGDNIKIDDTGMATFYDRIVPNVANDVLKKLGGGKVENIAIGNKTKTPGMFGTRSEANKWLNENPQSEKTEVVFEGRYNQWSIRGENGSVLKLGDVPEFVQQGFTITPEMRAKAMEGMPLFQKEGQGAAPGTDQLRGAYTPAENLVELFKAADKSTALHEIGHSWLEEMKILANRTNASPELKADWEIIRRELAIGSSGEIGVASHEQWARSVERYVSEGKAPSLELQAVFTRFRDWLMTLWKTIRETPIEVNDDLRGVLDRMLATDEQIREARELGVPRAYVDIAKAEIGRKIVPGEPPKEGRKIEPGEVAKAAAEKPFADELPTGPGEAPDTSRINYKYINSTDDLKLAMQRLAELDQEAIQKQRGGTAGVKSWDEANAEQAKYLNDILGGSEDTLRLFEPRDPDAPHVDVRLGILKKLAIGAARDSAAKRDIVIEADADATVMQQLEYMASIERARMIQAEFLGERASVARALNALKDVTEGTGDINRMLEAIDGRLFQRTQAEETAFMKAKLDEIMLHYKGKTVLDIAKLHKEIGTLKGTFKLAKEIEKASTWEKLVEGWKSALLSGPVTHVTNLFGTGAFHEMRPAVDAVAAGIGMLRGAKVGMGEGDRASMREALGRVYGYHAGTLDGLKAAVANFNAEQQVTSKTEQYKTAIEGRKGEIIRIPLRLMGAEDALVNTMYTRGELHTIAIRQAFAENLDPRTREFAERTRQLVDNPTPEMQEAASIEAVRATFNQELGEKGRTLQLFVNKWNLQWMIPFIRTPINITKEVARMSPVAPMVGEWRAAIAKGGVARDKAIAEVVVGSALMSVAVGFAFSGDLSGAGSPDPGKNKAKEGVWQPYSVLINGTWYEYSRIQPIGTLMGLAADMAAVWDHMTDEEMDKIPKMISVAFANAVTNQTFLQGITNVVNAMSDPTRFASQFMRQFARSAIPNIIGQPTSMADPYVREVNSMLEAIQSRIPGGREKLLPKIDWLGEPVETKERLGVISPIRQTTVTEDKVRTEAARLNINVSSAPKKVHLGKGTGKLGDVELTPEERNKFGIAAGKMAHKILSNIVNAPGWDATPDPIKRKIYSRILSSTNRFAAATVLPPDKKAAYIQQIMQNVQEDLQTEQ